MPSASEVQILELYLPGTLRQGLLVFHVHGMGFLASHRIGGEFLVLHRIGAKVI